MGTSPVGFVPQVSLRCSCFRGAAVTVHRINGQRFRTRPLRVKISRVGPVSAIQVNAVSGGNDGEVTENEPEKSYSVGVTIVSGFDAELRRRVIENIVASCTGKRVVVVTASGISSTAEQDGTATSSQKIEGSEAVVPGTVSSPGQRETSQTVTSATDNLEGWLSCSSYEEMAEVISKLAASREYDYIVAEGATATSIGPQQIAVLLQEKGRAALRVDTLVSVLNGDRVLDDLHANDRAVGSETTAAVGDIADSAPESLTPPPQEENPHIDQSSTLPMVIVSLVENANVIVLNRELGEGTGKTLEPVQSMISVLNRKASVVPATDCTVPVQEVVNTNLYDSEDLLFSASWKLVLIADRAGSKNSTRSVPKSLKDATFVYRARRPFHPERLSSHIRDVQTFSGVIRSTGKIWLATRMLAPLEWNQAGESATLQLGPRFWASRPEEEWPKEDSIREVIMENWDTQFGDRETELVFVGMGIDKERLQGLLDGCLLQDEEMVFTNLWENFKDPFIEWVPLIEDDDEMLDEDEVLSDEPELVVETPSVEAIQPPVPNSDVREKKLAPASATDVPEEALLVEGALMDSDISNDLLEKASALDALAMEYLEGSDTSLAPFPSDTRRFDEDDVVLSSGEESVAEGILQQMPKVGLPVTIVTGFLGSGKTTLLNYILTAQHGLRVAVLVNEFGEIDIDSQLVEKGNWSSQDEVMELSNGCICCSINDSFVSAVKKILERKDDIDYLIVETTGVADPVPVLNSLMVADLAEDVRVDSVLTVVSADSFENSDYMDSTVARAQISSADTILLSKTDIASAESIEKTMSFVQSILPSARILRSQRGQVPIGMILDVGLRIPSPPQVQDREELDAKAVENNEHEDRHKPSHDHEHGHSHEHNEDCDADCTDESHSHSHNHLEAEGFMTTSFRSDIPLVPEAFMEKFLQRLPKDVFRAKGLLNFYGYPQRIVFQLSGRRYAFEEDEWPDNMAPGNQIVIIGRDLNVNELQENLKQCHVQVDE